MSNTSFNFAEEIEDYRVGTQNVGQEIKNHPTVPYLPVWFVPASYSIFYATFCIPSQSVD